MKLVVDTSIIIDKLRGGGKWDGLVAELKKKDAEFLLPSIVIFEIFSGQSSKDKRTINKITGLLSYFRLVDLTSEIAQKAGEIYRDNDSTLGVADYVIAATAMEVGAQVVTLNQKHFRKIPGLVYQIGSDG